VQMGLFGLDAPVLIGCPNTLRIAALQDIGGYKVHNADDLLTSLHLHAAGWRGTYVPEVLAFGRAPTSWEAFLRQQFRWAHSVMDVMHHHFPRFLRQLRSPQRAK